MPLPALSGILAGEFIFLYRFNRCPDLTTQLSGSFCVGSGLLNSSVCYVEELFVEFNFFFHI